MKNPTESGAFSSGFPKKLVSLAVAALIALSLGGCAAETNYKVLSFFFDGVPKPVKKQAEIKKTEVASAADSRPKQTGSVHGPYAARFCYGCHNTYSNALLLPVRKLCFKCHVFHMEKKKYIHGPLASGGCIVCHDPHSSANRFLLVSSSDSFCFYCHNKKDIEKNPAHKNAGLCTDCHNPHMSNKKYMLK
jgi:predicted CXXCH cytochrome family protein